MLFVPTQEPSYSQPHLHGVDPRIRNGQTRVRDVEIAQFKVHIMFRAEDVQAKGGLGSEVNGVRPRGNVVICEKRAATEFKIGRQAAVRFEVPLEAQGIEADSVRGIGRLEGQKDRDSIDRIFKPPAKQAR